MALSVDQVYRDFNTQGVPASGDKKPIKAEIRALLKMIQNGSGQSVTRNTVAALNAVTPPTENYMGIVLTGAGAGYYYRSGAAWVFGRSFPDSFALFEQTGGSANALLLSVAAGVNPGAVVAALLVPDATNSGPATISISGATAVPLLSAAGAPLGAGELVGGKATVIAQIDSEWRVILAYSQFTFRGAWDNSTNYVGDDITENEGSLWLANRSNTNVEPVEGADWTLFLPGVTVADGSITEAKLAGGAVSRTKLEGTLSDAVAISPTEYGAVDDGSDQDAEFALFEAAVSGQAVDLGGREFNVAEIPTGNIYFNGTFVVPKTTTVSGVDYDYDYPARQENDPGISPSTTLLRDARSAKSSVIAMPIQTAGVQGVTIDEANGFAYTHHISGSGVSEVSYISQYSIQGSPIAATSVSLSSAFVGHQGLTLEYGASGTVKLWSSARFGDGLTYPDAHRQVLRFSFPGNGVAITGIEEYTLFGTEFSYTPNATMPAISYDQRYLCAVGRTGSRDFFVRVFDLAKLVAGGAGDYSDAWIYEWKIDPDILTDDAGGSFTPVQGIACDGAMIYVLSGNSTLYGKRIHAYTMRGVRVQRQDNLSVGITDATSEGTFYEPEALFMYKPKNLGSPVLGILILSGAGGARINRLWALGYAPDSGRWTPTISTTSNVAGSTAYSCHYTKNGATVTGAGRVAIDPTAAGLTSFEMSPPVPSNFTSLTDAAGTFACNVTTDGGGIEASVTNDKLVFSFIASDVANRPFYFTFVYQVK